MNVLSLFDGMSCGQQALERAGIKVDNYFASEIDKYAIKVTMANYPNTIQLGSVVDVDGYSLPKIDLLIGGSPCQSFSFAGKRKGMSTKDEQEILSLDHYLCLKSEGYEFEGQSYLFWEYMRLLNELRSKNPNVFFFLENVEMGEKWEKVLSRAIGVNGIHINSALVSAQNRKRIYWTNIGMKPSGLFGDLESIIQQPKDKGILLKDILEKEVDEKYFLSEKLIAGFERHKERHNDKGTGFGYKPKNDDDKGNSLRANAALCPTDNSVIVHNTMPRSSTTGKGGTGHLSRADGKTYCLDTGNTNAVEIKLTSKDKRLQKIVDDNTFIEGEIAHLDTYNQTIDKDKSPALKLPHNDRFIIAPTGSTNAVEVIPMDYRYDEGFGPRANGKSPTLTITNDSNSPSGKALTSINNRIRRLTPTECERLQTVKDNEISCIFALCLEKAKNYVNVVSQNPRLLKLVLDAENSELNELVKNALLNMSVNHQSIKHTVPQNADMQIQKGTNQCTNHNQQGSNTNANNAELNVMSNCQREWVDFAQPNVFINIIEGRITHFGLEELHQKDNHSTNQLNGSMPLKLYGNEIMELAKGAIAETTKWKGTNFTYITLYRSNTKSLEQMLIIYYLFAKNAIIGYTQNTTQTKSLLLNFNLKDGYTSVASDSQRYKMLGNGWTVDVIVHFFNYLKSEINE